MSEKIAFITGITGQDGSYLTELLLEKGYTVHGLVTPLESIAAGNIKHLAADPAIHGKRLHLHAGSFGELTHLRRIIAGAEPDEFYHFAGQSSPRLSFELPEVTADSVAISTLRLLEILHDLKRPTRFLNASSAEVFGTPAASPQDEQTPVNPATPYGASKAFAQQMTRIYRTAHDLPACSAILYNHESPRRGESFVTMKIARAAARIKKGLQTGLALGSTDAQRDWGWAPDYVEGMWRMLQPGQCDDYILATGELHSVAEFVEKAFQCVGLDWRSHVKQDDSLMTAAEPVSPCGNPAKAEKKLHWTRTVDFGGLVQRLVASQYDSIG